MAAHQPDDQHLKDIRDNAAVAMALRTEAGQVLVAQIEGWVQEEVEKLLVGALPEVIMLEKLHQVRGALQALEPIRDRLRAAYQAAAKRAASMQMQVKA